MFQKGVLVGTIAGILLGLVLWQMEQWTTMKVYTLLMNVDFIPIIGGIAWPNWVEWLFHLSVSIIIGVTYITLVQSQSAGSHSARWAIALLLSILAALTYFPLTDLAIKETPSMFDLRAITLWGIAHIFYGITLKKLDDWFRGEKR